MVFCCRRFRGKPFIFKDGVHQHAVDKFSQELKTNNKIFGRDLASSSLDLTVTKKCMPWHFNWSHTLKYVIKTRGELVNAACRIYGGHVY